MRGSISRQPGFPGPPADARLESTGRRDIQQQGTQPQGRRAVEGFTKLLFDKESRRILGAGITGPHAGELIAECALAIEMGCEAADIGLTIHPHPTLSESIGMAAEIFAGTITDLYLPR